MNVSREQISGHLNRIRSAAAELELECDFFANETLPGNASKAPPLSSTTSDPPDAPEAASELPIAAGHAALAVVAAMANLVAAICAVERLAMALARAADVTPNLAERRREAGAGESRPR